MKKRTQKKAADRLKSLQEVRVWLLTHRKSDSRTSAIRYIDILIDDVTSTANILILKIGKDKFIEWERFNRLYPKFKRWLDSDKK